MNKKVVILGGGNVSRYVCYILSYTPENEVVGYIDPNPDMKGEHIRGKPVLGSDEELYNLYSKGVRHAIIGVGDPDLRHKLRKLTTGLGLELINAIHPSAIISPDVNLGCGNVVMAGVVMSDNPIIDDNVWIGLSANITHDTHVCSDCLVGGGSAVGAQLEIGERTLIGWGSVIGPRLKIGEGVVVGSGANVVKDVPPYAVVVGNPADILKFRKSVYGPEK